MEETKVLLDDSMFEKLDDSEKNTEFIAMESKTYLQDAWPGALKRISWPWEVWYFYPS